MVLLEMKSKALLIGINYIGTSDQLTGCINDVAIMKDILINKYGFDESNILVLTDNTQVKPTKNNIINAINWLLSYDPSSVYLRNPRASFQQYQGKLKMYFHYSGHGTNVRDNNRDETDGYDEAIAPLDFRSTGFILDDDLRRLLPERVNQYSICRGTLDCCNSGTGMDLRWNCMVLNNNSYIVREDIKYNPTNGNVIFISACNDSQLEGETFGEGILTNNLKKLIHPSISVNELLKQVTFVYTGNNKQSPVMSFGSGITLNELWL